MIRRRHRWPPVVAAAAVAALVLGACGESGDAPGDAATASSSDCGLDGAGAGAAPTGPITSQRVGDAFPVMTLAALDGCAPVSTGDWLGDPLVVNFWASWCAPCREEMPDLAAAAAALDGSVRIVGVTHEDAPADSRAFLEEVPVPYDTYVDADGHDLFRAVRARAVPTTVLVDPDGVVVFRHAGPISRDALLAAIDEHLGVTA